MIIFIALDPRITSPGMISDVVGFIPSFLVEDDPRPAKEQFAERYIGGWLPFEGFTFDRTTLSLEYEGDPPMRPLVMGVWREEKILVYPHAWVLILQKDGSWEASRLD